MILTFILLFNNMLNDYYHVRAITMAVELLTSAAYETPERGVRAVANKLIVLLQTNSAV